MIHGELAFMPERINRIKAAQIRWKIYRRVFTNSALTFRYRITMFRGLVYAALLSGLNAFCLSDADIETFNAFIANKLTYVLCGRT